MAHPDDESFMAGGLIAKYLNLGWKIELLCATHGEAGQYGPYDETADIGAIRTQEMIDAAQIVGISEIHWLDYKDGQLSKINPGELEDKIHKVLLLVEPSIVITFEPNGISNHPDHKRISVSTTFAFQKYAKTKVRGQQLGTRDSRRQFGHVLPPSDIEPKLYFGCMPESIVEYLQKNKVIPTESFGKPWKGIPDKKITTIIDIEEFTQKKIEALSKHKTQEQDVERFVSINNQPLAYKEYFVLRMQGEQEVFMGNKDQVASEL